MHPFLCAFAERLRGASDLLISHPSIVGKYAGKGDYEQFLHTDFMWNTPVVPRKGGVKSFDVPMLIYHSDVTVDLGPTYLVGWEHTENLDLVARGVARNLSRQEYPQLYEKEIPATVPAGSVLIYSSELSRALRR